MFDSVIGSSLTIKSFMICLFTSLVLGFIVSYFHLKTSRTNKNFVTTLMVLPILVTMVMFLVNGNLGTSVAIVGAFSLIRFRSVPGNSKEILLIFFVMAIGLATGTGYIGFAIFFTLFTCAVLLLCDIFKYGEDKTDTKVLKIVIPESFDYTDCFNKEFNKYLDKYELKQAKTTNMGSMFELTYFINLKKSTNEKEFIDKMRIKNGNLKVSITHPMIDEEL